MLALRPYQLEAVQSIYDYFSRGNVGNPLVCMPTGTGKSLVIGHFVKGLLQQWPSQRVLIVSHVKELLKQNSDKLLEMWPHAPYGMYSAGLNKRDTQNPIMFGGIQSMVHNIKAFGHRDLMLIDEAHLLGPKQDTMYAKFIKGLREVNPYLKVIGFTATPYRLGQGLLTDGGNPLFTDICFNNTGLVAFNKLIADGYLAPPISKRTVTKVDLSDVGLNAFGEYESGALEEAIDKDLLNRQVCREACEYGADRRCWLAFASGIKHAEHIAEILRSFGITAAAVHSKMGDANRVKALADFKRGALRCLVNNNVLTTGFDHPNIDLIIMLRPTQSTGLWVQMLGRGTRPSLETGKENCLTLDFSGNTARLGPINDPLIPTARGKQGPKTPGVMPAKICEACGTYNHPNARECIYCGVPFPSRESKLDETAASLDLLAANPVDAAIYEWFDVQRVTYAKMFGTNRTYLQVSYVCGVRVFYEEVFLEGTRGVNKLKDKAVSWWKKRMGSEQAPPTVDEALKWTSVLAVPMRIQVHLNKMFNGRLRPEVIAVEGLHKAADLPKDAPIWWNGAAAK